MEKLPIKPLFDRVLLHREQMKTVGSIIIPDDAARRNAPTLGVCVAKGPNADDAIEIGKTYIHGIYAGTWINERGTPLPKADTVSDDAEFYICIDEDLLAEVVDD